MPRHVFHTRNSFMGVATKFRGEGRPPITASRGAPPSRISGINSTLCDIQIGAPWNFFALTSSPQPPFSSQPRSIIHALRLPFFAPFLFSFLFSRFQPLVRTKEGRKEGRNVISPSASIVLHLDESDIAIKMGSRSRFPKNPRVPPSLPCLIGLSPPVSSPERPAQLGHSSSSRGSSLFMPVSFFEYGG